MRALDTPRESARFDRFALTVSTERVGWWNKRRFHHRASFYESTDAQTPAPAHINVLGSSGVCLDQIGLVCADPDVTDGTPSARVSGVSWLTVDFRVPHGYMGLKNGHFSRQVGDVYVLQTRSVSYNAQQAFETAKVVRYPVHRGVKSSS